MKNHIINIAYDRKNGTYVAYNIEHNLFATGVCVESACEAYRVAYYTRLDEITEDAIAEERNATFK